MNSVITSLTKLYAKLLHLYPARFRNEFAEEMQVVFRDSVNETTRNGILPLVILCLRELAALPFNVLREFWHEFQREQANMQLSQRAPMKQGSWGDSFRAGLPHLLIAIVIGAIRAAANTELATISGIVLALLLIASFLTVIYYTWRNKWPAWGASWYGYAALIAFLYAIQLLQAWNYRPDESFNGGSSFILLLLGLAALLYWLTRRNPIEGLLMGMPLIILYWLPDMEIVPDQIGFWLEFGIFALSALTAMTITRLNDIQKAMWLVLGVRVLGGLAIAYAGTYWQNIPTGNASPSPIGQMVELFSEPWLTSSALVLGPILGWGVWFLGAKQGKVGRAGALLILCGWIINLIGNLSYWWMVGYFTYWWQSGSQRSLNASQILTVYQWAERSATFLALSGFVMILIGATSLATRLWRQSKLLSAALILVPLALPLVLFPTYFGDYIVPAGFSFEFAWLADTYRYMIWLLGALWLVMSGWTIARLYNPLIGKETA